MLLLLRLWRRVERRGGELLRPWIPGLLMLRVGELPYTTTKAWGIRKKPKYLQVLVTTIHIISNELTKISTKMCFHIYSTAFQNQHDNCHFRQSIEIQPAKVQIKQ